MHALFLFVPVGIICHEVGVIPLICYYLFHSANVIKLYNYTTFGGEISK